MKTIAVVNNLKSEDSELKKKLRNKFGLCWTSLADNALSQSDKPFFVPDFAPEFSAAPALGVKICRLGKSVETRFASRYRREFTGCISFRAETLAHDLASAGLPQDMALSFDKSLFTGKFLPASILNDSCRLEMIVDGSVAASFFVSDLICSVDEVISAVSNDNTIKIGDIIIPALPETAVPVNIGQNIILRVCADDALHEILHLRIK